MLMHQLGRSRRLWPVASAAMLCAARSGDAGPTLVSPGPEGEGRVRARRASRKLYSGMMRLRPRPSSELSSSAVSYERCVMDGQSQQPPAHAPSSSSAGKVSLMTCGAGIG